MTSDTDSPDDSTPLLPSQGTILSGTPEETANSRDGLAFGLQEATIGDLGPNRPRWSWAGLPERLEWIDQAVRSRTGLPALLGWIAILALLLGIATVNMESSFMLTAYLKIGSGFGDQQHAAWLLQAYQISITASRPFYSFFADRHGRMKPLIASYGFFAFGVMLCGISSSLLMLAFSRLLVGMGSGAMWMLVSIIWNERVDISKRALWETVAKIAALAGQLGGERLGGPFVEYFGWQRALVIPVLLALLSLTLALWKLRETPMNEPGLERLSGGALESAATLRDLVLGGALLVTFAASLCLTFHFASTEGSWCEPPRYLALSSLVISGLCFIWHQCKTRNKPLVDFGLICQSPLRQIFLATVFREGAVAGLLILIPWYSVATGKEVLSRWSLMMGLSLGLAAGGFVANACFVRWKALKAIYIVFEMVSALAACMMCVRWIYTDSLWEACAYVFVFGLGASAASATFLVGLVQVTRADRQATMYGSKMLVTDIAVLGSITVSNWMLLAILAGYMRLNLRSSLPPGGIEKLIKSCKSDLKCIDGLRPEIRQAIRLSLKQACIIVLILHIFCILLSVGCGVLSENITLGEGRFDLQQDELPREDGQNGEEVQQTTNQPGPRLCRRYYDKGSPWEC